ncbi:MAG: hypothetical protein K6F87_03485 [Lachnospiraceae bacterium]|nr:hypothetical protein [Lachnospiraceae bacterium]
MTIYIAICDNNIADRKALERLLEREKDKRLADNYDVLYIDSFGSEEALMATPVKYDIFFIDVTEGASNGMEIAKKLRLRGINAPIVLQESKISYTSYVNAPEEIIYIEKPINKGQVSHLVEVALDRAKRKMPLIEVRCQKDTRFIRYDELIRAIPLDSFYTRLCLTDGEFLEMTDSISSLFRQCESFGCFVRCKKDIVNIYHIESATDKGFRLTNGDIVNYSFSQKNRILKTMADNMRYLNIRYENTRDTASSSHLS